VGWILFYLSLVLFQSLVVDIKDAGFVGREIHVTLLPFIGKAGLWLFWLMIFMLALVLVIDDDYDFRTHYNKIKALFSRENKALDSEEEQTEATPEESEKIMSLSSLYTTVRSIFQNPFNFQRKRDIEDILHMPLEPIEEIETPRYTKQTAVSREKVSPTEEAVEEELEEPLYSEDEIEDILTPVKKKPVKSNVPAIIPPRSIDLERAIKKEGQKFNPVNTPKRMAFLVNRVYLGILQL